MSNFSFSTLFKNLNIINFLSGVNKNDDDFKLSLQNLSKDELIGVCLDCKLAYDFLDIDYYKLKIFFSFVLISLIFSLIFIFFNWFL